VVENVATITDHGDAYDSLRDTLIDKLKQSDRTNYTSSFGEDINNC
jgi:hypothetical protein